MWEYNHGKSDDNELCHYGVLGMKWGMHRAAKKGTKYTYKSYSTKRYEKKAAKETDQNKKKIYKNRAKASAKMDAKEQDVAKKISFGHLVASIILDGGLGLKAYQRYRAIGEDGNMAFGLAFVDANIAGGMGHRIVKGMEIRKHDD